MNDGGMCVGGFAGAEFAAWFKESAMGTSGTAGAATDCASSGGRTVATATIGSGVGSAGTPFSSRCAPTRNGHERSPRGCRAATSSSGCGESGGLVVPDEFDI